VILVAVNDDVRSLLLKLQLLVGENAGELEDAMIAGLEATHFQVNPQQLRPNG
jgi:hypothetical protein